MKRAAKYQKFFTGAGGEAAVESGGPVLVRAAEQAMDNAARGLAAYAALPLHLRSQSDAREARKKLEKQQSAAAIIYLIRRDRTERPPLKQEPPEAGADPQTVLEYKSEVAKALEKYRSDLARTRTAREAALNPPHGMEIPRVVADEAALLAVCHQTFTSRRIMDLTTVHLLLHRDELSPALLEALQAHVQLLDAREDDYEGAYSVLMHYEVDVLALPHALKAMESVREELTGSGEQLCLAAAREIESGSAKWQLALECADAVHVLTSSLRAFMQRAEKSVPALPATGSSSASHSSAQPAQQSESAPDATESGPASRSRRRRVGRRQAPASTTLVPAAAPPPEDRLSLVASRARQALARLRPLTRDMAARDEPVALARSLGQDTGTIDLLRRHQADPIYIASAIRSSFPKWFGDADRLRSTGQELALSLSGLEQTAPELADLSAQVNERIGALDLMLQRVTAEEIDAIKQYALPKERHLERLLELGQIAHVNRPAMLPSDGDTARDGTLFEMMIRPTQLGDGSPAPAFYLHLHTKTPVSAGVGSFSRDRFAAVHVKTQEQKNLGAKWEQLRQKLGYDDKVHRGSVGTQMLDRLQRIAA